MTLQPDFVSPMPERQAESRSHIYGSEYRDGGRENSYIPGDKIHYHGAPCAVCLARRRTTVLMLPGASSCPVTDNWNREYSGFLMAARNDRRRSSYICVDGSAETSSNSGNSNELGDLLLFVEAHCNEDSASGGLPCGPYVDGYELTCVVCTI